MLIIVPRFSFKAQSPLQQTSSISNLKLALQSASGRLWIPADHCNCEPKASSLIRTSYEIQIHYANA